MLEAMGDGEKWAVRGLPGVMLLWANMHGGYILGDVFIGAYLVSGLIRRRAGRAFMISCLSAMALSLLNPNGATAFTLTLVSLFGGGVSRYGSQIVELQSVFSHGSVAGVLRSLPFLALLGGISIISFILAIPFVKRMRPVHVVLFVMGILMFYVSMRFLIFFVVLASMCTAVNHRLLMDGLSRRTGNSIVLVWPRKAVPALAVMAALGCSWFFASTAMRTSGLPSGPYYRSVTENAARFMHDNGLRGRIFNEHDAGGELIWWLYPELKPFTDGRALSLKGFEQFRLAMDKPLTRSETSGRKYLYQDVLDGNDIRMALLPGADKVSGTTIALSMVLLQDPDWSVVYADLNMILYMRQTPETQAFIGEHRKPEAVAYQNMLALGTQALRSGHARMMPGLPMTMSLAHKGLGNKDEALFWIDRYLSMRPQDRYAIKFREEILNMP
jgi:hypothetical protein